MRVSSLIRKLASLDGRERLALLPATFALLSARVRLRVRTLPRALEWADVPAGRASHAKALLDRDTERRIRAVERMGHYLFPRNPCLTEALVVQRLLSRRGYPSELRIGVRKHSQSRLEAHAWVEYQGAVVVGARGLSEEHVPLPPFGLSGLGGKVPKGAGPNAA